MPAITYRLATQSDIPAMSGIRALEWETEGYWQKRIAAYLSGELNPQKALKPRIAFVAEENGKIIGFNAGHLTQRYGCDGELEWINVVAEHRGSGAASGLLRILATWFVEQKAFKVCVNAAPDNLPAVRFYQKHGAGQLNEYFLVWNDIRNAIPG